ncbi:crotonase/enoyl-CoA hydratase family protein [Colwelliaceae bacterium BS250]
MNQPNLLLTIENNIAIVTLNKPEKRNALDLELFKAIDKLSQQLKNNRQIRAVIVTANGEDFCSGLDIKSIMKNQSAMLTLLKKLWPGSANLAQRVSYNWRKIPVPVIMAIDGRCWGGGLQIALGADFRIASLASTFSIMEGKWGLIPDMAGNLALREIVNKDIALKITMTAEIIDANTALKYGLVTELADEPFTQAMRLAAQISERSPDAVAAVKKLYQNNWFKAEWIMLAKESYYQVKILLGKNQKIAVKKQLSPEKDIAFCVRKKW